MLNLTQSFVTRSVTLALAATFTLVCTAATHAAPMVTRTTAFGNGADTYSDVDGNIQGGNNLIRVRGSNDRITYLRFDISDIDPVEVTDVTFDIVKINIEGGGDAFSLYGLNNDDTLENFNEGTFNDTTPGAFTAASIAGGDASRVTDLADIDPPNDQTPLGFTQTDGDPLVDFIQADTNGIITFVLVANSGASIEYASKENTTLDAPALTFTLIPEPGSFALLGVGALAGCVRRRRC